MTWTHPVPYELGLSSRLAGWRLTKIQRAVANLRSPSRRGALFSATTLRSFGELHGLAQAVSRQHAVQTCYSLGKINYEFNRRTPSWRAPVAFLPAEGVQDRDNRGLIRGTQDQVVVVCMKRELTSGRIPNRNPEPHIAIKDDSRTVAT